jgi:integral membrane protein (TIGR01906 family)
MKKVLIGLIVICFLIVIFLSNLGFVFYNEVSKNKLLSDYFNSNIDDEFSEKEKIHLNEIKELRDSLEFVLLFFVIFLIVLLLYLFFISKKAFLDSLFLSGVVGVCVIVVLFLIGLINFDFLFVVFHRVMFSGENWILNANHILIEIFPLSYFYGLAKKLFLMIFVESLVLSGLIFCVKKKFKLH